MFFPSESVFFFFFCYCIDLFLITLYSYRYNCKFCTIYTNVLIYWRVEKSILNLLIELISLKITRYLNIHESRAFKIVAKIAKIVAKFCFYLYNRQVLDT